MGKLLRFWRRKRIRAKLNWLNWGEIYYITARNHGREKALEAMDFVAAYPLELEPVDFALVEAAAELEIHAFLRIRRCILRRYCTAISAILVTGDPEFHNLEDRIKIHWTR